MQIITINLPIAYIKALQILNDLGMYPSRTEAVRTALREFLHKEKDFEKDLNSDNFKELMEGVKH